MYLITLPKADSSGRFNHEPIDLLSREVSKTIVNVQTNVTRIIIIG